jgi:uncharacterized protein (DUF58 family)
MDLLVATAGAAILIYMVYRRLHFTSMLSRQDIVTEREVLERVVHKDSPISVRVEARSDMPFMLTVKDKVPPSFKQIGGEMKCSGPVGPGRSVSLLYSLIPTDRGSYQLPPMEVHVTDPRGLFSSVLSSDPGPTLLVQASKKDLLLATLMGRRKRFDIMGRSDDRRTRTVRADFKSIRDYAPGDRFRDIDWKATSRLTRMMTKEFETERNLPTMIMMDCSLTMRELTGRHTKLDHAIALAIQAASVLKAQGNPVGLIAFDEHKVIAHRSPGRSELDDIMIALFDLPNPARTGGYPGYTWDRVESTSEDESRFLGSVGPFLVSGKRMVYDKKRTTGIYEAVRMIGTDEETGMLLILITDMETSRESIVSSLSWALKMDHRVVMISAFSWPYHAKPSGMDKETLELVYMDHTRKQEAITNLRAAGVRVLDVTPKERGDSVIGRLRRMGQ